MRSFEWGGVVEFASYELEVRWDAYGDLVRASDVARYPGAEAVAIPLTVERYRIAGYDPTDVIEDLYYTFVKRDGRWGIASDSDLDDLGFLTARHLWDFGPVASFEDGRFLALTRCSDAASCARLATDVLAAANEGLARADDYWRGAPLETAVVMVPASIAELTRILQATFDLDDFVAFALSFVEGSERAWFTGPRIAFGPDALDGASSERVLHILGHELLHVMSRGSSGPFVPLFLEEGFAEYAGLGADGDAAAFLGSVARSGGFDGKLPADHEFTTGPDIFTSYQEGQAAVGYIVDRYGLDTFNRLYIELGRRRIVAGTARYHLDRVFRRFLGISFATFERAWAGSIRAS